MTKFKQKFVMLVFALILYANASYAQNVCPGVTVVGRGYDIFGEYANNKSVKEQLFRVENYQAVPMDDGQEYKVPDIMKLKFINEKDYKTTEGSSLRQYASSINSELGLEYEGLTFSGSIDARFGKDKSEIQKNYFYTITDWTRIWEVYINPAKEDILRSLLTPDAQKAIDTWAPEKLFDVYGTHYVNSGYFGGAMEYNLSQKFTNKSEALSVGVSVKAKYATISGNNSVNYNNNEVNESFKSNVNIMVRGGGVQYANKSSVSDNSQYNKWVESIPSQSVLIDFRKGSLVPIWTLAANQQRRSVLEAAFKARLAKYPLPEGNSAALMMADELFYLRSVSENKYWDLSGFNYQAEANAGAKIQLYDKDINNERVQGADRFIKIISHTTKPEFVFLQPQHSHMVADIAGGVKTPGAALQLWHKGEDNYAQMFKLIEVNGQSNTYYIENAASGLYLTANKNGGITQENKTNADNQKWVFESANAKKEMADFNANIISIENVAARGKFLDVPGAAPNQGGKGTKMQLWSMDYEPDRYFRLQGSAEAGYYFIHPMNSTYALDLAGGSSNDGTPLQIWDCNKSAAQSFRFEYAGEPLTFFIVQKGSNKVLEASNPDLGKDAVPILLATNKNAPNQKWKLTSQDFWQFVPENQNFHIKSAYTNKYFDLPADENSANANGKEFNMWDLDGGKDRIFKIHPSGDARWVNIQVQNGGRYMAVPSNSDKEGVNIILYDKTNGNDQKFAIMFTSPTTFVLRTNNWRAVDIKGGGSDEWKQNGAKVMQYGDHYGKNQQFQLIYADGPNKGRTYNFVEGK